MVNGSPHRRPRSRALDGVCVAEGTIVQHGIKTHDDEHEPFAAEFAAVTVAVIAVPTVVWSAPTSASAAAD